MSTCLQANLVGLGVVQSLGHVVQLLHDLNRLGFVAAGNHPALAFLAQNHSTPQQHGGLMRLVLESVMLVPPGRWFSMHLSACQV